MICKSPWKPQSLKRLIKDTIHSGAVAMEPLIYALPEPFIGSKKQYPQIQSVLILAYFPKHPLWEIYDYSIFPEGLEMGPTRFAINQRNRWIIQNCHSSICYVNHAYGGAYAAYQKLVRQNKVLRNLGTLTL